MATKTYAERLAITSTQTQNYDGENWDEALALCIEADKEISQLEDDLLSANDICVEKTRKLMLRIKELEATK